MATAAATLTIRPLSVDELASDALAPMVRRHWEEVALHKGLMRLDPDWLRYRAMEQRGLLLALALEVDGEVVGYTLGTVAPHLHYQDLMVYANDAVFVDAKHRGGGVGLRLMRETERVAKSRGAQMAAWHAKQGTRMDALMPRLGYGVQDIIYTRAL